MWGKERVGAFLATRGSGVIVEIKSKILYRGAGGFNLFSV